nr:ATP-dependent DNA helicase [Lachnospiraceae bacterium]
VIYCEREKTDVKDKYDRIVNLFCADPSTNLRNCLNLAKSSVLFSATLIPIQYYKSLLGGDPGDFEVYAKSVFKREQCGYYIASDVTSRYSARTQRQYDAMASYVSSVVTARKGNYIVFCPSHAFLSEVLSSYERIYKETDDVDVVVQKTGMTEDEKTAFLAEFSALRDRSLVAFCVMGGMFSEGIDLRGSMLIGALIIGTGIPMVCRRTELLKSFFDEKGKPGYDYAYCFPGMNKVLQAAGRVIRTSEDRGVVALLDNRFLENRYIKLFPREWENWSRVDSGEIRNEILDFWDEDEE